MVVGDKVVDGIGVFSDLFVVFWGVVGVVVDVVVVGLGFFEEVVCFLFRVEGEGGLIFFLVVRLELLVCFGCGSGLGFFGS